MELLITKHNIQETKKTWIFDQIRKERSLLTDHGEFSPVDAFGSHGNQREPDGGANYTMSSGDGHAQ